MRPNHSYGPSTYSIVGADPEAGECGVAVQSKFLAVGAFVPWARGGVGAVATQAYAEITYGSRGLDLLESGLSPEDTIDRLTGDDEMRSHRQVGVVAADGRSASYTGEECFEYAVSVTGDGFAAQGNILSNPDVPEAMAETFRGSSGRLADRLLAALTAGETAGGEKRGMESAALLVVKPGGGYGGNHDRWLDLRIDHSDTPIEDLSGLLDLHTLYFGRTEEARAPGIRRGSPNGGSGDSRLSWLVGFLGVAGGQPPRVAGVAQPRGAMDGDGTARPRGPGRVAQGVQRVASRE